MPINATYQRPPWVPPPHESSAGTVIPQLFAQGLARGQQQRQHEEELRLREEEALRQQQVHERTTALASRRFAATAAFQDAMRRDLAMAETQVANLGDEVDEDTVSRIASRNFLLYGAAMNEGGGGAGFPSFLNRQQTESGKEERFRVQEDRLNRALQSVDDLRQTQGDRNRAQTEVIQNPPAAVDKFARPELGRLALLRDASLKAGNTPDAEMYQREIDLHQGKQTATAKARAHTELATTLRQQMRAIDSSTALKPADKEGQKAVLMQQIEASRRSLIGDLEAEAPTAEDTSRQNAITRLDKEIADLEVDLTRNPKQGRMDFGKDNRVLKAEDLKAQRERLGAMPSAGATAPASPTPPVPKPPRPPGLSDTDLLQEARDAIKQGKDPAIVRDLLKHWGVTGDL